MPQRPTPKPTHWHATVAVRVPETDGGNLTDGASRRLARAPGIDAVEAAHLQAVEPGLAATVARLEVRLRVADCLDGPDVEQRVADAPGVQRIEAVGPE